MSNLYCTMIRVEVEADSMDEADKIFGVLEDTAKDMDNVIRYGAEYTWALYEDE